MLVFPQLATGAAALYPVMRRTRDAHGSECAGRRKHGGLRGSGCRDAGVGASGGRTDSGGMDGDRGAVPGRVGKVHGVHVSGSGGQPAAAQRGVRRAGVGQRSTDSVDAGRRRSFGNHAGDAGGQRGIGCGGGGADAGGAGEFPVCAERVGEDDGWIKRNAIGNDRRRERDAQYRADEPVDTGFLGSRVWD